MTPGTSRVGAALAMSLGCLLMAGCGKKVVLVPVAGTITMDGQPLSQGIVTFMRDLAKGNSAQNAPTGTIEKGSYHLSTLGQAGAPPGWYKVIVEDAFPGMGSPSPANKNVPIKYRLLRTTDLVIEVVADPKPGAYDLKLYR